MNTAYFVSHAPKLLCILHMYQQLQESSILQILTQN